MSKSRGTLKKDGWELTALRKSVENAVGHSIKTSNDFSELSDAIREKIREYVSVNTLKRIWNVIDDGNVPSVTTLSLLARFLDFKNWEAFLVHHNCTATSQEFLGEGIRSDALQPGDRLAVTWEPNRRIEIQFTGNNSFVVEQSQNSKLAVGDTFKSLYFFDNQPLFIDELVHEGFDKPISYVCGKKGGVKAQLLDSATLPSPEDEIK